jgi:hypothetical protein
MTTAFATSPTLLPLLAAPTMPDWAAAEAKAINERLRELRIAARCVRSRSYDAYGWTCYGIELGSWADGRRERVDRVATAVDDLNEVLTNLRRRRTVCRLERTPLTLEVPHPASVPLAANQIRTHEPHQAELGLRRDGHGVQRMVLDLDRHHHTLVAAASGYGKSVLLSHALLQLATHTSPADLRLVLVDLKNDDLPRLAGLPHVATVAGTPETAAAAVALVDDERRRRIADRSRPYRLVLAIDELAQLPDASQETLANILATGRSLGINALAATQIATAQAVGKLVARLFTLRLVGRQDGARAAAIVAGRPDTGAHELPWPGDFLWIDADVLRFRAYVCDAESMPAQVANIQRRWSGTAVAQLHVAAPVRQAPPADDSAARAQTLLAQGASRNAICQELWSRPYAGGYKAKLDRLLAVAAPVTQEEEAEDTEQW